MSSSWCATSAPSGTSSSRSTSRSSATLSRRSWRLPIPTRLRCGPRTRWRSFRMTRWPQPKRSGGAGRSSASPTSSSAPRSPTHSRRSSLSWPEPECNCVTNKGAAVRELLVDFITSLDGYASGEGWPGWWGLQGPEYLAWLEEQPEVTYLMGANTYRLMPGFAAGEMPEGTDAFRAEEDASIDGLTGASKVVFSSSLDEPLTWANSTLVRDDAVDAVRAMKEEGSTRGPPSAT